MGDGGVRNMTERWLICNDPSLLRLSNIGCGAMQLQSASLKPCEQAPISTFALCTFGGYRYCLRLNHSVVNLPFDHKMVRVVEFLYSTLQANCN